MATIGRLFVIALAGTVAAPAAAQNIERAACTETYRPSPNHALSIERNLLVADAVRWAPDTSRPSTFAIRYTPTQQEFAAPLRFRSAELKASWQVGQLPPNPTLLVRFTADSTAVPSGWIARFRQDGRVLGEMNLRGGGSVTGLEVGGQVPQSLLRSQPIEIEFLSAGDQRRLGRMTFNLAGFSETDWHRARRDIRAHAATLTGASTPPTGCTRQRYP